jgi:hypothetical protein
MGARGGVALGGEDRGADHSRGGSWRSGGDWTSRPFMVENNVTAEDCESISNSQSVFPKSIFRIWKTRSRNWDTGIELTIFGEEVDEDGFDEICPLSSRRQCRITFWKRVLCSKLTAAGLLPDYW